MIATLSVRESGLEPAEGEVGAKRVPVLLVAGRLDASTVSILERALLRVFTTGARVVVVDMGEVSYISSSGLRVLLTARRQARERSGDLVLCNLSASVRDVFDMVGFAVLFKIADDVERGRKEAQILLDS
jgi:anti-sigma B factor antagonist